VVASLEVENTIAECDLLVGGEMDNLGMLPVVAHSPDRLDNSEWVANTLGQADNFEDTGGSVLVPNRAGDSPVADHSLEVSTFEWERRLELMNNLDSSNSWRLEVLEGTSAAEGKGSDTEDLQY